MPQPRRRARYLLTLAGGPCAGSYETVYARRELRAVIDVTGKCDVLDAPGDQPSSGETVHAYVADPRKGRGHALVRPGPGLWLITYRYLGAYDHATGEIIDPLSRVDSEQRADDWLKAETDAAIEYFTQPPPPRAGTSRKPPDASARQATLFPS